MTLSWLSIMAHVNVLKWARAHQCYDCSSHSNYFLPYIITETRYKREVQAQERCNVCKEEKKTEIQYKAVLFKDTEA